ncbi:hypothetical protein O6H91_16G039400 [Diphasiastrum complanatum]|nr:hypothetical protein O6H91_16G039400 [Diphasiastrum complanatum]
MLLASGKEQSGESGIDRTMLDCTTSDRIVSDSSDSVIDYKCLVVDAMFHTLLGLDANDPPKTLATLQFYCSVLSSVEPLIGETIFLPIDWSLWLDEFLGRVFVLLVHLESNTELGDVSLSDGLYLSSRTFLMQEQSLWTSLLELLFSRLSTPLFRQALKKISKFVLGNILPGAAAEVGFLCAVIVYAQPKEGVLNLLEPILGSVILSLTDTPSTGFSGTNSSIDLPVLKAALSPGLETSVLYHLNILSVAVMYSGPAVLHCKELLKKVIACSFDAPSPKVNEAGNRVLSSLLGTLVLYFPLEQYKSCLSYPGIKGLELWINASHNHDVSILTGPRWHIAERDEIEYAKELVNLHLTGALLDLQNVCQGRLHGNDTGKEKEHLRVIFLRLDACLRGLRSCLPDFKAIPEVSSCQNNEAILPLSIVGEAGIAIGDSKLREEAAETVHEACKFLLKERADDTTLLMLLIRVMDLIGNYGSLEYSEWSSGRDSWRVVSGSLSEPHVNFITDHHALGLRRPQWLVVEMTSLHNTWRASQSKYRPFYGDTISHVPHHITLLSMDLLNLCLQTYDAVRVSAGDSLKKMLKRFPPLIKDCIPLLTSSLKDPQAVEQSALGACMVLMSRPVLRHLTENWSSLTSFISAVLGSSHHESLKAQRAINELFISFQIRFGGVRRGALTPSFNPSECNQALTHDGLMLYVKEILESAASSLHWRYNLMGHGMLLSLASLLPDRNDVSEADVGLALRYSVAGHFLRNLKSELPPLRPISAIALLLLLGTSRLKQVKTREETLSTELQPIHEKGEMVKSCTESILVPILKDHSFCESMVHSLALDHHYSEGQGRTGRGGGRFQLASDLGITAMMPSVSRGWPRTLSWESSMKGESFSPRIAKLFKCLLQECGSSFLEVLHSPLQDVINEVDERSRQCIAAEVMAGILHSDVPCISEAWDLWLEKLLYKALMQANVESVPEWAACIRYTVTGKGKIGQRAPTLRHKILVTLAQPLPSSSSTSLIVKRLDFLLAATVELSPTFLEKEHLFQLAILEEVVKYMTHSAPQVRESVGRLICILYSNLFQSSKSLQKSLTRANYQSEEKVKFPGSSISTDWERFLVDGTLTAAAKIERHGRDSTDELSPNLAISSNNDDDESLKDSVKWMETIFHFTIGGIKSGRAAHLVPVFIGILHPLLSSQDTAHKDMSALARSTVHLLKWQTFEGTYASQALTAILGAAADSNWRTRIAALTFLQIFVYRHAYILERVDIALVWERVQLLLSDLQVEVREMATATLSGFMKGVDSQWASAFRDRILDAALSLVKTKSQSSRDIRSRMTDNGSIAPVHGVVLGLVACILSAPYDIPRWLPNMILALSKFRNQPAPIRGTVTKTISEFRRTHADTWAFDRIHFSEDQLEVLSDLSSSTSYFV